MTCQPRPQAKLAVHQQKSTSHRRPCHLAGTFGNLTWGERGSPPGILVEAASVPKGGWVGELLLLLPPALPAPHWLDQEKTEVSKDLDNKDRPKKPQPFFRVVSHLEGGGWLSSLYT